LLGATFLIAACLHWKCCEVLRSNSEWISGRGSSTSRNRF
jgi:hypothetical protein